MIPVYLKLRNFLSHDLSEIDFEKFDSALILGTHNNEEDRSNGSGKSSLFSSIVWALFGKSRHKKKDGVVKWDRRKCVVEFTFNIDDIIYKITRSRDKVLGETDVIFERFDGAAFVSILGDTNTATDKIILDTINVSYDVFLNSVYFKQDDISIFATTTPGKRKDILKALLRMDKWDNYQKATKDKAKILKSKIDEKSSHLVDSDLKSELKNCENSIKSLRNEIKKIKNVNDTLSSNIMNKKIEYQNIQNQADANDVDKLQKEYNRLNDKIQNINDKIQENNNIIINNNKKVSKLQQEVRILKNTIKSGKNIKINEYRAKLINGKSKEEALLERIEDLKKDIKLSDKCDLCKKALSKKDVRDIKIIRKAELTDAKKKYDILHEKVANAIKSLQSKEKLVSDGINAELKKEKIDSKINQSKREIDICIDENKRLTEELDEIDIDIVKNNLEKSKNINNKTNIKSLQREIEKLEKDFTERKKNHDKMNIDYGSKMRRRSEIIKLQKEQNDLQSEIDKLKLEYRLYEKLKGYFGKDGVQAIIIENIIEELENYTNDTLSKICNEPTSISIKTQRQNDNGTWTETFDILVKSGAREDDFDTFSGGEKFRISLALRLALSNILSNRMGGNIRFLLLDEVSANLDNKGVSMFMDIIKNLSKDMKVLIITHNERLKEKFEDIIIVNKGKNGSKATFY